MVIDLLLPTDEEPPEAIQPGVCPLRHPMACSATETLLFSWGFFAFLLDRSRARRLLVFFSELPQQLCLPLRELRGHLDEDLYDLVPSAVPPQAGNTFPF